MFSMTVSAEEGEIWEINLTRRAPISFCFFILDILDILDIFGHVHFGQSICFLTGM
jgi:hypothetical protein